MPPFGRSSAGSGEQRLPLLDLRAALPGGRPGHADVRAALLPADARRIVGVALDDDRPVRGVLVKERETVLAVVLVDQAVVLLLGRVPTPAGVRRRGRDLQGRVER